MTDKRTKLFMSKILNSFTATMVTVGLVAIGVGTYMIIQGNVYLVSGEGIVKAYSFTQESLIGLFTFLLGCGISTIGNTLRTTTLGLWLNEVDEYNE